MKHRPTASEIHEALAKAGRPKCMATIYGWLSGAIVCPTWAVIVIAEETGAPRLDLLDRLGQPWIERHPVN